MITLEGQYHLINVLNTEETSGLFVYLVLDRNTANLALARHKLNTVSKRVSLIRLKIGDPGFIHPAVARRLRPVLKSAGRSSLRSGGSRPVR